MPPELTLEPGVAEPSTHGQRGVLFSMCLALVLVVGTVSAINLALPELAVDLHASNTDLTWIADGYTVALAALVLPLGALGDRMGRRTVLLAGTLVFGLASLGAASADTTTVLISWRVLMGVGAAMIMPGTLSTITAAFPPDQRARGVATWAGFASAGAVIGLLAAGALLEQWGWEAIFVVTALGSAAAGLAAATLSPNSRERERHAIDWAGAILLPIAVGSLVFGIIEGNEQGFTDTTVVASLAAAVGSTIAWALAGLRVEHPLLDPRLFTLRGFRAGGVTILVQFMAVFGFFFVGLQYLQLILGYSPLKAAVALVPVAVVVLPVSQLTPRVVARAGLRNVMTAGLALLGSGMLLVSRLNLDSGYIPFLAGLLVAGVGIGLTSSTGTAAIVGALGRDKQGVASAMNDTTREVGSAIGIAVMGSVYGSNYRTALPDAPAQLPQEAVDTIRESAAAGLEVARRIGGEGGDLISEAVRGAFIDGLTASLLVIGVVLLVTAAATFLRAPKDA